MKRTLFVLPLLLAMALAGCQAQADTSGLEQRLGELETRMMGAEENVTTGAASAEVAALEARVAELESMMGEMTTAAAPGEATGATDVYPVVLTLYELDNAGFHGMDETLNEEGVIDPSYVGRVLRVERLMAVTPWAEPFQPQVAAFRQTLNDFAAALESDDVEAAKPLSAQVHEEQHDLSHDVGEWVAEQMDEGN